MIYISPAALLLTMLEKIMVPRNLLLLDDDPVEPPQGLDILLISQHQLNRRTVFEFRVDRKCETQFTKPPFAKAFQ